MRLKPIFVTAAIISLMRNDVTFVFSFIFFELFFWVLACILTGHNIKHTITNKKKKKKIMNEKVIFFKIGTTISVALCIESQTIYKLKITQPKTIAK